MGKTLISCVKFCYLLVTFISPWQNLIIFNLGNILPCVSCFMFHVWHNFFLIVDMFLYFWQNFIILGKFIVFLREISLFSAKF
jgi:hypothetical protein